jgi:hypothetical protein
MQEAPTSLQVIQDQSHARQGETAVDVSAVATAKASRWRPPLLLYGVYLVLFGVTMYVLGVLAVFPRYLTSLGEVLTPASEALVWYSGAPILLGFSLAGIDLLMLLERKRSGEVRYRPVDDRKVTVVLTAYNDEMSIGTAVRDFAAHLRVARVIVVSNNSSDRTYERAQAEGAIVVNELRPGYGRCVHRCLSEAIRHDDAELVVLSEGDCTFRAYDIDKLLAYAPHADIVNGTRTVEKLRQRQTQLTTFMFYGNLFVGKLLEAKHLGRGTITDVGTTYKLCHRDALERLLPALDPSVNLEFNAHLLDRALGLGLVVVECPITFHARVGLSKGGNTDNLRALAVGLRMMRGLTFGWGRPA